MLALAGGSYREPRELSVNRPDCAVAAEVTGTTAMADSRPSGSVELPMKLSALVELGTSPPKLPDTSMVLRTAAATGSVDGAVGASLTGTIVAARLTEGLFNVPSLASTVKVRLASVGLAVPSFRWSGSSLVLLNRMLRRTFWNSAGVTPFGRVIVRVPELKVTT